MLRDLKVQLVPSVFKDYKVTRDLRDWLVPPVRKDPQVHRVHKVIPAFKVHKVQQVPMVRASFLTVSGC